MDIIALMNQSNDYCTQGNYQKVIECCDKMLDYQPENIGATLDKAIALANLGMYSEAIQCLDIVLSQIDDKEIRELRKEFLLKEIELENKK